MRLGAVKLRSAGTAWRRAAAAGVMALLLAGGATTAPAQEGEGFCGERADLVDQLERMHSEHPVAMGLAGNGRLVEVFASDSGETWTLMVTLPNGVSCILSAGESWTEILPRVAGEFS